VAASPNGRGYWLVASDGGIFAFGDAAFAGSTGAQVLNRPMVDMAPTPSGHGYWLAASDGGVFAFGDAAFAGSTGGHLLVSPVTSISAATTGTGYWLAAGDGGVFSYGAAGFHGSAAGLTGTGAAVDLEPTPDGGGYWMSDSNGGVFAFGDAAFFGSAGGTQLNGPIVAMAPSAAPTIAPQDYAVTGDAPGCLLPGTSAAIALRITNPNPVAITVVSDTTTVTTSSGSCPPSNFWSPQDLHVPVVVPAGASVTLAQAGVPRADWPTVAMRETAADQDACAGIPLALHYRGEAIG
jgi:hypothetical protein